MAKSIIKFNSLQEQEEYHLNLMRKSSVQKRFKRLYAMQQISSLLRPPKDFIRKIIIKKLI